MISKKILQFVDKIATYKKHNRYCIGIIEKNYNDFLKNLDNDDYIIDLISKIISGNVLILRAAVNRDFCDTLKIKLNHFAKVENKIDHKILNGIKNGFYISKNLNGPGYKTLDRSFYFFSFNKDLTGIFSQIMKLYKPLKILNGLDSEEYSKNIPSDGVVERLHVIHYPDGGGQISKHTDSIKYAIANFGLYLTEFGKDYEVGGFYAEDKNSNKIIVDKYVRKGDFVIFFPGIIHGVDPVYCKKNNNLDISIAGRWFVNINIIESHHIKNREYSKKVD